MYVSLHAIRRFVAEHDNVKPVPQLRLEPYGTQSELGLVGGCGNR
jgi:hypothetical protein